ncbi:hypothetical protein D9615_005893 [Tricholomella constricta]|uniref:Uncharacterized protein n=1 Tax=Tricholomella constricta TaxID=117010 RepID=A0A8H5H9E4_9AGAR|nr:hypothetical protein D9615_005893 [Tricholomella constricta]
MSSSPKADLHSDKSSSPMSSSPPKQITMVSTSNNSNRTQTADVLSNQNLHSRPLSDIIGETFPPFDHKTNIVTPFNNEMGRDVVFEQELSSMLLNAILETHAWASTRPKHESSLAAQNIEQKIVSVMETEKEQGMSLSRPRSSSTLYAGIVDKTRQQLNHFVTQIKTALAALTGLAGI